MDYILHEDIANDLYDRLGIDFKDLGYVGYLGHKRYTSNIDDPSEVWSLTAIPLYFSTTASEDSLFGVKIVLQNYIHNMIGKTCDSCEVLYLNGLTLLYPIIDGSYIYVTENELDLFTLNLDDFIGTVPLSRHPLAKMVADSIGRIFGVRVIDGITVCDGSMSKYLSPEELNDRVLALETEINGLESRGTAVIRCSTKFYESILTEVTHVWGFKRNESLTHPTYSCEESALCNMVGCTFSKWLEDSVYRVMNDLPPLVPIVVDKYYDMDDRSKAITFLKYACIKAIRSACNINCEKVELELRVTNGLVAYLPVWGPEYLTSYMDVIRDVDVNELFIHTVGVNENSERANERVDGILVDGVLVSNSADLLTEVSDSDDSLPHTIDDDSYKSDWGTYLDTIHGMVSILED